MSIYIYFFPLRGGGGGGTPGPPGAILIHVSFVFHIIK